MKGRQSSVRRATRETTVELILGLDGSGAYDIATGVPFLDHMLAHLAMHGLLDLDVHASGDTAVDDHHTVEDIGIALGQAIREAVGDKKGIWRYGSALLPMDEALVEVALDLSGRGFCQCDVVFPTAKIGAFDTELVCEFLRALAMNAGLTLHVRLLSGKNSHHIAEAIFKALGRALRQAVAADPRCVEIPSTKGVL